MSQRSRRISAALLLSALCGAGLAPAGTTEGARLVDATTAEEPMEQSPPVYFVAILQLGSTRVTNTPRDEFRGIIANHRAYLKELLDFGVLVVGGPYPGFSGGVLVLKVESAADAEQVLAKDPGIAHDVFRYEIRPIEARFRPENRVAKTRDRGVGPRNAVAD